MCGSGPGRLQSRPGLFAVASDAYKHASKRTSEAVDGKDLKVLDGHVVQGRALVEGQAEGVLEVLGVVHDLVLLLALLHVHCELGCLQTTSSFSRLLDAMIAYLGPAGTYTHQVGAPLR
jgi:hypothetical protein